MLKVHKLLLVLTVLLFVSSCATTKLTSTWKDKDYTGGSFKSVLIVGAAEKLTDRIRFEEAFVKQLTTYSDQLGNTCDEKHANFPFGPYIRRQMPPNPLPADGAIGNAAGINVTADKTALTADGVPTTGWKASTETGEFICNNATYANQ